MVETWSPLTLWIFYTLSAGAMAAATLARSEKPWTPVGMIAHAASHGLVGGACGMQLYELKKLVWTSYFVAIVYGGGMVKLTQNALNGLNFNLGTPDKAPQDSGQ